jgi:hypothetical protein
LTASILLAIQIDGIHIDEKMLLVAAIGVDANGDKLPLGLVEGATENATTMQALIDNLVERGLDPTVPRLFIIDGATAPSKAIRRNFGRDAAIQRCQIYKAHNILERLPKSTHASVRRVLWQTWEITTLKGPNAHWQSRPPSRTALERRFRFDPGKDQRDAHRYQARPPLRTAPLARLHPHHRQCHGHGAQSLPQGAMGRRRHARSVPSSEGIQASASPSRCSGKARPTAAFQPGACSNRRACVNFNAQRPLREFQ